MANYVDHINKNIADILNTIVIKNRVKQASRAKVTGKSNILDATVKGSINKQKEQLQRLNLQKINDTLKSTLAAKTAELNLRAALGKSR